MTQLSKNFTLAEMIEAGSARRLGLDDQFHPSNDIIVNLTKLCCNVLQPLKNHFVAKYPGKQVFIHIDSGYRSPRVNKAVGGAKNSDHLYGYASDTVLIVDGQRRNQELFDAVLELKLPFRQMIDEFGTEDEPAWVHISYNDKDLKHECLRARKVNGKTVYTKI